MHKPTVIVVAGPTAVGKTAIAIRLAQHFNTSIISCDSRQCYKELNTGVAKPTPDQLQAVPHYFINSNSIQERVDAALFENYALTTAEMLFTKQEVIIMTGGTGMYLKAFCEGLDAMPRVTEEIQNEVRNGYAVQGMAWLQAAVANEDPVYFATGEIENPQRLMRALEVKRSSGKSIRLYQDKKPAERSFQIIKTGLQTPRELLKKRIDERVDKMITNGLMEETEQLLPYQYLNALQTVGYQELFDYFGGKLTLHQAVEQIKIHTRQYAKRQMTWFKKDTAIQWFDSGDWEGIKQFLEQLII